MDNLLKIKNLSVTFDSDEGKVHAVDDVSMTVNRGEVLGIVGESGCGKSVATMSILRLIPSPPGRIESGTAMFNGQDLLSLPIDELRKVRGREISIIFQEPMTALSPLHRIGNQLVEGLQFHRDIEKADAWKIGEDWLRKTGIPNPEENMHSYPFQLSGGMRQRVMIAMALMLEPQLIIADEPTTALDVTIQAQIFDLIREMRSKDTSMILITHDMGVIWEMCDRVQVMYASEVVETGTVKEIFNRPLHPYTKALLESIPTLSDSGKKMTPISGSVPSPLNYPKGCRFRDRCKYAFKRCGKERPELYEVANRTSRCFRNCE